MIFDVRTIVLSTRYLVELVENSLFGARKRLGSGLKPRMDEQGCRDTLVNAFTRAFHTNNFVRIHHGLTLDRSVPRQLRFRTPAMAASLTDHRWSTLEILHLPLRVAGDV